MDARPVERRFAARRTSRFWPLPCGLLTIGLVCCGARASRSGSAERLPTHDVSTRPAPTAAVAQGGATSTATAATPSPAPEAAATDAPAGFVPAPELGRFVPITCTAPRPGDPDGLPQQFLDLAVAPDGSAWVVGMPSVRLHVTAAGATPFAPVSVSKRCYPPPLTVTCDAYSALSAIAVRGAGEAYVAGGLGCGLDPNCVWSRDLDVFDGSSWRPLPGSGSTAPEGLRPRTLAVAPESALYAIAVHERAPAYPDDEAIAKYGPGGWRTLRLGMSPAALRPFQLAAAEPGKMPPVDPKLEFESYARLDVVGRDVVWVAGALMNVRLLVHGSVTGGPPDGYQKAAAWRLSQGQWQRFDVPAGQLVDISAVSATEAWAVGDGLWHFKGELVESVPVDLAKGDVLTTVWAAPTGEIWLGTRGDAVLVLKEGRTRQVALLDKEVRQPRLRGHGRDVWVTGGRCVWKWQPPP